MANDLSVNIVIGAALAGSHTRTMGTVKRSMKDHVRGVGSAIKEHRLFQTVMVRSDARMKKLGARQETLNRKLGESKGRWLALGAAIYGASRMIKSAAAIEEQGNFLRTVINAPDKDAAVGRAMAHSRKFARGSLASQQEVLEIEYQLNSAGLSEEVSRSGTELIHKLAKVTKGAPGQVGKIFATTFNNLGGAMAGTTEEKMGTIADVLAKTQFAFQLDDFNQLGQSMAYASATVASAKINFEQSAAALGVLNGAGLEGSRAGTGFNAMMRNMTKAGDELGFGMVRGADGTLDLIATLEGLQGSLDGMDIDERGDLLQKLFGDEGKAAIVPLIDQLDNLKKGTDAVSNSAGTVSDSYKIFLNSSAGQMTVFGQNLQMIGNVLAGSVLPGLNLVLKPLGLLFGGIAWAIEKFPPLGWIIGGLTTAIIGVAAGQLLWTAAQWALNSAMFASPITWIIAGIIAVGLGVAWMVKNWDTVKVKLGQVWVAFKKFALKIGKLFLKFSPLGLMIKQIKWVSGALGKLFGGKKMSASLDATMATTPLPAMADLPPPASAGQPVSQNNKTEYQASFTINQQPGQNGEDVATEVDRHMRELARQAEARDRRMLHDG